MLDPDDEPDHPAPLDEPDPPAPLDEPDHPAPLDEPDHPAPLDEPDPLGGSLDEPEPPPPKPRDPPKDPPVDCASIVAARIASSSTIPITALRRRTARGRYHARHAPCETHARSPMIGA